MKKMILSLTLAFVALSSVSAMSYEEARRQALFLTDKMAYELNLNDQQYEDCYEINLDYLLSVETADDAYGNYLAYRNADLRHILLDWQYTLFAAADYFLHPLYWHRGVWHYPIYRYYAVDRFFYGRPHVYFSYRGGHGRFHYTAGYYGNRRPHHWGGGMRGMDRGAVGHHGGGRSHGVGYHIGSSRSSHGYTRPSSTRSTVYNNGHDNGRGGYSIGHSSHNVDGRHADRNSHSVGSSRPDHHVGRSHSMSGGSRSGSFSGGGSRSGGFSGSGSRSGGFSGGGSRSGGFSGGTRSGGSSEHHGSHGHGSRGGR